MLRKIVHYLLAVLVHLWAWIIKPSMTRVVVLGIAVSAVLFLWTHYDYRELSVVPLAWLISIGMCFILYTIDRSGFAKIDTVAMLKAHPKLYAVWIGFYFACILAGHAFAYWIIGA